MAAVAAATSPIDRTASQRLESLRKANEIRIARANLKRQLRHSNVNAATLIADPPDWLNTMRTLHLLQALPYFGPIKARKLMRTVGVSDAKTIGGLSDRQRDGIVRLLQERTGG